METIKVVLVEDHTLMRKGVRSLLERDSRIEVVGEAESATEMLRVLEETPCHVLLLDMSLPEQDGEWCAREVKKRHPEVGVLVVSMHEDSSTVMRAMRAGADGYITKNAPPEELIRAISCVFSDQTYIQPHVAGVIVKGVRDMREASSAVPSLTQRERDVLQRLQHGRVVSQIGDELSLSPNTVKSHLASLYRKLGVSDRLNAVMAAVRLGLLPQLPADGEVGEG